MGLLNSIFGSRPKFNKNELILFLAKVRIRRYWMARGLSDSDATDRANEEFSRAGIDPSAALGLPEAGIVVIVESYINGMKAAGGFPWRGDIRHFEIANSETLHDIESYRSAHVAKGDINFPTNNLEDYICYRINLEMKSVFNRSAIEYGLDRETIKHLTYNARKILQDL